MKTRFSMIVLLLVLALVAAACATPAAEQPTPEPQPVAAEDTMAKDIVDTAVAAGSFNTLVAAVQAAGLEDALRGDGPFTVFAPTDEAFAALPEGTVESLLADPEGLSKILLYHVISGKVMAASVSDGLEAETLEGAAVNFSIVDGKPMINDANIVATDVEASNGVIHVIDAVILPPAEDAMADDAMAKDIVDTAVAAGSFNTLVAAVQAAGLEDALRGDGPFTVFAPTDEAFAALPEGTVESLLADPEALADILLYHVIAGKVMAESVADGLEAETLEGAAVSFSIVDGKPMINDANIVATDVEASNGVIHVIDAVILPPAEDAMADDAMAKDIVDTAVAAGSFNTLVAAVQAAGLEDALRGDGPFTVFAPTDEAFAALPEGTVESLLADPEALADILLYHVIAGKVMAESVADGLEAETLEGAAVSFSIVDGKPMINGANIVATDVEASNGVIHVIDAVILPPAEDAMEDDAMAKDIVDTAIAAGSFNTLIAAVQAAGLEDALRGEGPLTVFAPTDEAFAALPEGTLESLLANPEALADILLYHVASGKLMATDVIERGFITTLLERPLAVTAVGNNVTINNIAKVLGADIEASNGVIHVIDTVLIPAGN